LIALAAGAFLLFQHSGAAQLATLLGGAIAGAIVCRSVARPSSALSVTPHIRAAWIALAIFVTLLIALPTLAHFAPRGPVALASIFYRSGAFVFGGGHVVLPLLQQGLVPAGWVSNDRFLSGYGFAQAMPGPLFTVATYLGAVSASPHEGLAWALLALSAIFLPGLLLAIIGLSMWSRLSHARTAYAILGGINAAVVGLLGAALYNPVWITAVRSVVDVLIVVVAFMLLQRYKTPPILIAALCVCLSFVRSTIT
jgi:chromate transporter